MRPCRSCQSRLRFHGLTCRVEGPGSGRVTHGDVRAWIDGSMDRATFDQAVQSERLERWLHLGAPTGTTANQLCLWRAGEWMTTATDERAGRIESTFRRFH